MLELLRRDVSDLQRADYQTRDFIGVALPPTAKLWSKAGYMSVARHDAALVEFADGKKIALIILTEKHSDQKGIIPEIARMIISKFTI